MALAVFIVVLSTLFHIEDKTWTIKERNNFYTNLLSGRQTKRRQLAPLFNIIRYINVWV